MNANKDWIPAKYTRSQTTTNLLPTRDSWRPRDMSNDVTVKAPIEELTILAHHDVKILWSLLGWKYFILFFKDRTSLTSAAGVTLIGQYKHTNINLTTEMGSDWLICHVLKTYLSPTIIINYITDYNDFGCDCGLRCVYNYRLVPLNLETSRPSRLAASMSMQLCVLLTK